jgi:hypothetical protein
MNAASRRKRAPTVPLASGFTDLALPIRLCAFAGADNTNSTANAAAIFNPVISISCLARAPKKTAAVRNRGRLSSLSSEQAFFSTQCAAWGIRSLFKAPPQPNARQPPIAPAPTTALARPIARFCAILRAFLSIRRLELARSPAPSSDWTPVECARSDDAEGASEVISAAPSGRPRGAHDA